MRVYPYQAIGAIIGVSTQNRGVVRAVSPSLNPLPFQNPAACMSDQAYHASLSRFQFANAPMVTSSYVKLASRG